jgi:hypothetical protein
VDREAVEGGDPLGFQSLYYLLEPLKRYKQPGTPKDVLVVLDSFSSGDFAKKEMQADLSPPRAWVLSSSPSLSRTSAIIVSDDTSLLNTL